MPLIANTAQHEAWNGYEGAHWAEHDERWNTIVSSVNEHLFARAAVKPADAVLDVGCGTGQTTRMAARAASSGRALGVDLSRVMLDRARALAEAQGVANVRFEQGDAQVEPFPAGGFDLAISRGAVMFFADPAAAFANIGRALRPGSGRVVFACPRAVAENPWFAVPMAALAGRRALDQAPPASEPAAYEPGMFSLADSTFVTTLLTNAGFGDIRCGPVDIEMDYGTEAAAFILGSGPVRHNLRGADQPAVDQARARLTEALLPYRDAGGATRIPGAWWIVTAVRR